MTIPRYQRICKETVATFWPAVFRFLEPAEQNYLRNTPAARRNLDKRIQLALAETLLSPDQISRYLDPTIEGQDHLPSGEKP